MAADPIDNPGFSIPTLQQYQQLMRQQAFAQGTQAAGGHPWGGLMAQGAQDLARAAGILTPQERQIASANQVVQGAVTAASGETDPVKNRLAQLSYMLQKFNQSGMSDLAAKVMPEYNALVNRQQELRKLGAEADSAVDKSIIDTGTLGAGLDAPYLKNKETIAQTDEANANAAFTKGPKAVEAYAAARASNATAAEKAGEYQNYVNPSTGQMTSVLKTNTQGRAALAGAGYVEDNINFNPQKTGDLALPKNTKQDLYKSLIGSQTQLDNITAAMGTYKPEYLTLPGKALVAVQGGLDKLGVQLSTEQHANLEGYQAFRSNSIKGLNQYIHDLTGAQMSAAEADRLRSAIADPERQGPVAFQAALRETVRGLLQIQARAKVWLDANGDNGGTPPTGDEWEGMTKPQIPEAQVDAYMRRFGIGTTTASPPRGSSAVGTTPAKTDNQLIDQYAAHGK